MKMTKVQFIERLRKVDLKKVKDDTVKGIIIYTLKSYDENERNVTVNDLKEVLADLKEAKIELPPLDENLAPVAEVKKEEEPEAEKPEPKKVTKKKAVAKKKETEAKPEEKKAEPKKSVKKEAKKAEPKKPAIPDEIKIGDKTIKRAGLLKDFMEADRTIYTVVEIDSETLHNEETYNDLGFVPKRLKSLPDNLDVLSIVWSTKRVAYAISVYTEVFYTFLNGKGNLIVYLDPEEDEEV